MGDPRVIAISRAIGAGGEEIGRIVARELGLRYADEEIIVAVAQKAGVSAETVARAESTLDLIGRIIAAMGRTPVVSETMVVAPILEDPPAAYEALIEQVVRETAATGDVVIVGHGGSIPLAGTPGLMRVLVTAPESVRAVRLARAEGMDEGRAQKAVKHSDGQRRAYLKRFYGVGGESPEQYDIVVNTEAMSLEAAARAVIAAASS